MDKVRERGNILSRVDWDSGAFRADSEPKDEARDEEVRPGVGDALPNAGEERNHGGHEDCTTPPEPLV